MTEPAQPNSLETVRKSLEGLRFSYERKLFDAISERFGEQIQQQGRDAKTLLAARRRSLLGDAVRVTADLLPQVHAAYRDCLEAIGGSYGDDLFVQQSPEYNANVFSEGEHFDMVVHSGLLSDFSLNEQRFVFGHELGHVLFDHSILSIYGVLENSEGLEPEDAHLLFRWSRASEVSADRIGLLCAGELTVAVSALFKTSSGLTGIEGNAILRSFRRQYEELQAHIESVGGAHGWTRSHPMTAIRFKALELAALDIVALRKNATQFNWDGFRRLDSEIANILQYLDVPVSAMRGFNTEGGQHCLISALLWVSLTDGALSWKHRWFIHDVHSVTGSQLPLERMLETVSSDVRAALNGLPDEITGTRDALSSENLQRVVAAAALMLRGEGDLTDQHRQTLRGLTDLLGISSDAASQAAQRVQDRACTVKAVLLDTK